VVIHKREPRSTSLFKIPNNQTTVENIEQSTDFIRKDQDSVITDYELAHKIDEAIMEDSPKKLHSLKL